MASFLFDTFFSATFWLPHGYTWEDVQISTHGERRPLFSDLLVAIAVGFVLLFLRTIFERYLFIPLAKYIGVKERHVLVPKNKILEAAYNTRSKPDDKTFKALAKQTDFSVRKVQRWFFLMRKSKSISGVQKFSECSWHFTFYTSTFIYSLCTIATKSWFWKTEDCWKSWPKMELHEDAYWYYMIQLGFYWSLVFTLLTDVKRKDYVEMSVHHISTITLMSFSFIINFYRIGTLVLFLHDIADGWLASAKLAKYSNHDTLCEVFFTVFAVVWIVTRIFIFPYWIISSTMNESLLHVPPFISWYLFNGLLVLLLILHIIWTWFIVRMVIQKLNYGELKNDARSDSESESDFPQTDSDEEKRKDSLKGNNHTAGHRASERNNVKKPAGSPNSIH